MLERNVKLGRIQLCKLLCLLIIQQHPNFETQTRIERVIPVLQTVALTISPLSRVRFVAYRKPQT